MRFDVSYDIDLTTGNYKSQLSHDFSRNLNISPLQCCTISEVCKVNCNKVRFAFQLNAVQLKHRHELLLELPFPL